MTERVINGVVVVVRPAQRNFTLEYKSYSLGCNRNILLIIEKRLNVFTLFLKAF